MSATGTPLPLSRNGPASARARHCFRRDSWPMHPAAGAHENGRRP